MNEKRYWSGLRTAWKAIWDDPSHVSFSEQDHGSWKLIKSEPRTQVILLQPGTSHKPLICKIYKTPRHLAWRTIGLASRANREFTALMVAHRRGLPVVRPRYWIEERELGQVTYSAITLEFIEGANLEEIMKSKPKSELRKRLAHKAGAFLRQLHRSGLYWATACPRNIMMPQGPDSKMLAIDMPYVRWLDRNLYGGEAALSDMRNMLRCKNQDWGFDPEERREFLMGYCKGDTLMAAGLEPLVKPLSIRRSKLKRIKSRSADVLLNYPRSPGKGGIYCPSDGSYRVRDSKVISIG